MSKVSILIPCYNAERFVHEAVTSALDQEYADKEIIVINDGSTDGSLAILQSFGDKIKLVSRENKGGNPTRNELLKLATGDWIQYLDADDYLSKSKIADQMKWIEAHPGFDVVYGPVMIVYDNGKERTLEVQEVAYPDDAWAGLVSWELPQTSSPLFRRSALIDVGGWNEQQKVCQEHELYFRLLKADKKFIGLGDLRNMTNYRIWGQATVSRKSPETTFLTRMKIMELGYAYMKEHNLLTESRKHVYMTWCLLVSRGLWKFNKKESEAFYKRNKDVFPLAQVRSKFITPRFQKLVLYLGYPMAERVAKILRTSEQK
jgi:glycosyltransferase involved in cell wall biosynthesis